MAMQDHAVLWVDNDEDDQLIAKKAVGLSHPHLSVQGLYDGEELFQYLRREGVFADNRSHPWPGIIFLGLHMSQRSGLDVLAEIRKDSRFKQIPVVMISTTGFEDEVEAAFRLGANAHVNRLTTFRDLCESIRRVLDTWLDGGGTSDKLYRNSSVYRA